MKKIEDTTIIPHSLVKIFFDEKWKQSVDEKEESVYKYTNPGIQFLMDFLQKKLHKSSSEFKALDLGAGDGRFSVLLAKNNLEVTAVDFSEFALERISQRAKIAGVESKIKLIKDSVLDFSPPDNYDVIIACNVLHYFNSSQLKKILDLMKEHTLEKGVNLISFESNIKMFLPDGREFKFANQPDFDIVYLNKFLKDVYKDSKWKVLYENQIPVSITPYLPPSISSFLKTEYDYYLRDFVLYDLIFQKVL